ncbi:hypothetical protein EDC65_1989 [Stella humosa]|uniref:Homeodomain-like domain-containing protein n=1 Tax=Stella humosa TaxID=94 RepID=A0A3N1M932_9PROT|nr:helix-turn-helix domain-containing protein [Stella humosa]ROQ00193.1 hypothetical protein EDC65_1989 [Stella humosa]BBK30572.1 hypothetical protein STHU_12060 [Stella humosa]
MTAEIEEGRANPSWPPTRDALAEALAAGQTLAVIGRRLGRSPASVSLLAARYGLRSARAAGRLPPSVPPGRSRAPAAGARPWPPSDDAMAELAAAGVGDGRAAALFGVHPSTYRAWRRRLRDRNGPAAGGDGPAADAADYGYRAGLDWPAWARFGDDPQAVRGDRIGRILRPMTVVEGTSSLALLAG